MFLKDKKNGDLVEVLALGELFDPFSGDISGRYQCGEELPEPEFFHKSELIFPSGEALPRCWLDPNYRKP